MCTYSGRVAKYAIAYTKYHSQRTRTSPRFSENRVTHEQHASRIMPVARTHTRAQIGIQAPGVTVEAYAAQGLPQIVIVGLPETAVRESKDRVRASSFKFMISLVRVFAIREMASSR